jgi:glutamate-1-semialdehyde aminotransferase
MFKPHRFSFELPGELIDFLKTFWHASRFRDETRRQNKQAFKTFWKVLKTDHVVVMKQGLRMHLTSLRHRREIVNQAKIALSKAHENS